MEEHANDLGDLANPAYYTDPLALGRWRDTDLLSQLEMMVRIRAVEDAIGQFVENAEVACPCHLAIGQEAVAVGVATQLQVSDRAFGAHRSHPHFLAMGGSVTDLLSEVLGKVSGCSRGMGASMHLFGQDFGFYGSVPIVAGTVPIAVGAGLAAKREQGDDIAIAYFGDGACEEGAVHESLNFAAVYELPVLFVCENNLYSSHMDIAQRQPSDLVSRFAEAHRIRTELVDGNDVVAVADAAGRLVDGCRNGTGPGFLEAVTYRWRGHVGPEENVDVGVRRRIEDIVAWKKRDPIRRLSEALHARGSNHRLDTIEQEVAAEVAEAMEAARAGAYPDDAQNLASVFKER